MNEKSATSQQSAEPNPIVINETDPWMAIRRMLLFDVRHDMINLARVMHDLVEEKFHKCSVLFVDGDILANQSLSNSSICSSLFESPPTHSTSKSQSGDDRNMSITFKNSEKYVLLRDKLLNSFDNIERFAETINKTFRELYRLSNLSDNPIESSADFLQLHQNCADRKRRDAIVLQEGINRVNNIRRKFRDSS